MITDTFITKLILLETKIKPEYKSIRNDNLTKNITCKKDILRNWVYFTEEQLRIFDYSIESYSKFLGFNFKISDKEINKELINQFSY